MTDKDRPLAFSFDWFAGRIPRDEPVDVCPDGHLRVTGRSCWAPLRFADDLHALWCVPVDHPDE